MLNRSVAPIAEKISSIPELKVEKIVLDNGVEFYFLANNEQEVCEITIGYAAGNLYGHKPAIASATCKMLEEGSNNKSGTDLSEAFSHYGAYVSCEPGYNVSEINLSGLHKFAEKTVPLLREMISEPAFREEDLKRYITRRKQNLLIRLGKADFVAGQAFNNTIFGNDHPYGRMMKPEFYDNLSSQDLKSYHNSRFAGSKPRVFAAGKIDDAFIKIVERELGTLDFPDRDNWNEIPEYGSAPEQTGPVHIKMPGQIQSAIVFGKKFPGMDHPDIHNLSLLSTVLGGYFGSRLMMNIREDKGFTYGVHSVIRHLFGGSYFAIKTQVGNEFCKNAIAEIRREMARLCEEKIPEQELELVKNYLMGTMLRRFDGVFAQIDIYKSLNYNGVEEDYYRRFVNSVEEVDSVQLLRLARQYFDGTGYSEIIVGLG